MNIIYIQLHMEDCRVEALINDIVVLRKNEKNIVTMARPIHEYLMNGKNSLALKVKPFGEKFSSESKIMLRVASFQEGAFLEFDEGQSLAEIQLSADDIKSGNIEQKRVFKLSWSSVWSWVSAPKLPLNESLKQHLNKLIKNVHSDFVNKSPNRIMKLQMPFYQELEKCYPTGNVQLRVKEFEKYITKARGTWNVTPLDFDNINYQLAANGKLIECINNDGLPIVRTNVDDINVPNNTEGYVAIPMHIGLLDNTLRILR